MKENIQEIHSKNAYIVSGWIERIIVPVQMVKKKICQ